ncbi:MAG: hypothetical protein AB7S75_00210 [Desulfococcaceae bacterium]
MVVKNQTVIPITTALSHRGRWGIKEFFDLLKIESFIWYRDIVDKLIWKNDIKI